MQSVGEIIKTKMKEKGLPVSEFARRINTNRNNVYDIFRRESIDTSLLQKISVVLEYNFFVHFVNENTNSMQEPARMNDTDKQCLKTEELEKEIEYLKQIIFDKNRIIALLEERIGKAGV
jgi:transcriptional regulator with XRE-family HTH domain